MSSIVVLVGNPQPQSRTRLVAEELAAQLAQRSAASIEPTIDLADVADELFRFPSPRVDELLARVASAGVLIVASPTYKASYTGLLKAFLDWFSTTGLTGVTTVPVMVGAGAAHALAVDVHLRPVLVEIGATLPTRGLYVVEADLPRLDEVVDVWVADAAPALRRSLAG